MHIWKWFRQFCSYKPLAKWTYLELIPLIALWAYVSLSLFWISLQALSEKPWSHRNLKEFWSFGIVLGIRVGGFVSLDNMFCWLCFMMYFGRYLMYIVYWLNVGYAEWYAISQMLRFKKKIQVESIRKRKRKAIKLSE